ncbi:MAG: hypothetical protein QM749_15610 [Aquabacterium sp.]
MSRLLIPLVTGLLWAGSSLTYARELELGDPVRTSLMDLARDTTVPGLPADSRMTFNRVWADSTQARLCALATRLDGDLLIKDGRLLMKRVQFRKRGAKWEVERSERVAVPADQSVETACTQRPPAEAVMTAAIKEMDAHPPGAGSTSGATKRPTEALAAPATPASSELPAPKTAPAKALSVASASTTSAPRCNAEPEQASTESAGPGMVGLPGRSLLYTAPDQSCRTGKFIVSGDKVAILARVPGWTRVRYTHPLTGAVTIGWVTSDRVKPAPRRDESVAALAR